MKRLNNKLSYALYILLCLVILSSCEEEKTWQLTPNDIMVIYENGYRQGYLNSLKNSKEEREIVFKKDSLRMLSAWK